MSYRNDDESTPGPSARLINLESCQNVVSSAACSQMCPTIHIDSGTKVPEQRLITPNPNVCPRMTVFSLKPNLPLLQGRCHEPRMHVTDIAEESYVCDLIGNEPLTQRILSPGLLYHPCTVTPFESCPKGPLKFTVSLPRIAKMPTPDPSAKMMTPDEVEKNHKRFIKTSIESIFSTDNEYVQKVNIGKILEQHTRCLGVKHIIPYNIQMQVLQVESAVPLKATLTAPTAVRIQKFNDGKNREIVFDAVANKQPWSETQGVSVPSNPTSTKSSYVPFTPSKTDKTEYEPFFNCICPQSDKNWQIFDAPKSVDDADFSRWINIQPSAILNELDSSMTHQGNWSIKIKDVMTTVPIYKFKYVDDLKHQATAAWVWLEVRDEAVAYMRSIGVDENDIKTIYLGTREKDVTYHPAPQFLLKYYVGRYFNIYNINDSVMPVGDGNDLSVHISPLHGAEDIERSVEHKFIPYCKLTFSITFDVFNNSKVDYNLYAQSEPLQVFKEAFNNGLKLT